MFHDARQLSAGTQPDCDLCIIGAGAAGIPLARRFAGGPLRVALLESGGRANGAGPAELTGGEHLTASVSEEAVSEERPLRPRAPS